MLHEWFTLINIVLKVTTAISFTIEFPHSDSLGIYNDSSTAGNIALHHANCDYFYIFRSIFFEILQSKKLFKTSILIMFAKHSGQQFLSKCYHLSTWKKSSNWGTLKLFPVFPHLNLCNP